jgi:hypothetical protein
VYSIENKKKHDLEPEKEAGAGVARHRAGWEGWESSEYIELMIGRSGGAREARWMALMHKLWEQDCVGEAG